MENSDSKKIKSSRFLSIKARILLYILPLIIAVIAILIIVSYTKSEKIIEKKSYSMLESSCKNQALQIEDWMSENLNTFNVIKRSLDSTDYSMDQMKKVLNQYYEYDSDFSQGLYISDLQGNVITADKSDLKFDNVLSSQWFNEGLTHITMRYGEDYKDSSGDNIISATGLIVNDNNEPVGVIAGDLKLDNVGIIVNSLIDMEGAEAFLINKNDNMVLASSSDLFKEYSILGEDNKDKFCSEVFKKVEYGNDDVEVIEDNLVKVMDIENTDWAFVSYVPKKTILQSVYSLGKYTVIIALIALVIIIVIIGKCINFLMNPIKVISEDIIKMSEGDFSINIESKSNDEIGVMAKALNKFIDSMRTMINQIQVVSKEQKNQSIEGEEISKNLFEASNLQNKSMKNLNYVVGEFASSTSQIANTAAELVNIVSDANDSGENLKKKMQETVGMSKDGKNDMAYVSQAIQSVKSSIKELESLIYEVSDSSKKINNIITIIGDIADSTNLLALNASIEAARAGESGKGFAVVADEIGTLANNSSSSVDEIANLIENINNLIANVVKRVEDSVENVEKSTGLITNSLGVFDKIYYTIQQSDDLVKDMLKRVEKVNVAADNMATISQQQAASAEEISSTSENMLEQSERVTLSSNDVAKNSDNLLEASQKLENEVNKFKL